MRKIELQEIVDSLCHKLVDGMAAFTDSKPEIPQCPWLKWAMKECGNNHEIGAKGIMIMQDWGVQTSTDEESIGKAVELINDCISGNKRDRTICNLLSSKHWKDAITEKKILVTNAVWGLRKKKKDGSAKKMCGYLGDKTHKRAFLTWGNLVMQVSSKSNDEFRLFVAGEWARFDGDSNNSGKKVSEYLRQWRDWAKKHKGEESDDILKLFKDEQINSCKGKVFFLSHPCIWNSAIEQNPYA